MSDAWETDTTYHPLLVPINIEALIVPPEGIGDSRWVDLKPDFRKIKKNRFLGQDLETQISTNIKTKLHKPGVHLHWALPDGLTHSATDNDSTGPEFPLIPNRWLIIRFWDQNEQDTAPAMTFKAWIVESDTIGDDESAAVWPMLDDARAQSGQEYAYCVRVGRRFELSQWPGETARQAVGITATGYGTPAFVAYYPACRGILGFHDQDVDDLQNVTLNYFVTGWYAHPSQDPLHQALKEKTFDDLDEFLSERKWTYPGFADALKKVKTAQELRDEYQEAQEMVKRLNTYRTDDTSALKKHIAQLEKKRQEIEPAIETLKKSLPGRILCHGVISGIKPQDKNPDSVPRAKPCSVAVGNTAIEALTALFNKTLDSADLVRLLEAFQYNLMNELEKPDGQEQIEQNIHERTFKSLLRGIRWDLSQDTPPSYVDISEEKSPPVPGDIRMLLENLNERQRCINRLKRERDSLKTELYATWYKRVLNADASREQTLTRHLNHMQQEIHDLSNQITAIEDDTDKRPKGVEWDLLQDKLEIFLPGYKLQPLDEPRFWRPNDPVLVLAGEALRRSPRHGEDGRFRSDDRLRCRLSGQEVTAIKMTIPYAKIKNIEFGPQDLDQWVNPPFTEPESSPVLQEVCHCIRNLFHESLLLTLNEKQCRKIAAAAYEKNQAGLADELPEKVANYSHILFDEYLKKVWQDAGNPDLDDPDLRYDVQDEGQSAFELVGKFPSPLVRSLWDKNPWLPLFLHWQASWSPCSSEAPPSLQGWKLNRQGTAFEQAELPQGAPRSYNDTTLLTPSAALNFSDRLRQYNLTHDNPQLKKFQTTVGSMNLLSQSLGGLMDQFLTRKAYMELHPLEPGAEERGPQPSPIISQVEDIDWLSPLTDSRFFPLRAGHLTLEKLWVIDAFGQLLKLEDVKPEEKNSPGSVIKPLVSQRLAVPDGAIRLEPRLAQASRLTIQWLSASRCSTAIDPAMTPRDDDDANPVCGWILPNFLDNSLMIYDVRGNVLGALQAVQRKSWDAGAGSKKEEIESFHWIDIPGSEDFFFGRPPREIADPLGENANPHLRAFVNGLLSLTEGSGQAFGHLLENINKAFSVTGDSNHNPNLALLIGKPLALIRASILLELDGRTAYAQGWSDIEKDLKDRSGGIENMKIPVRLGNFWKWNDVWRADDGLVGFFLNQNYSRFYPACGLEGRTDDSYSKYHMVPTLSINEPLNLSLLMNPSRGICVTTGILPRKIFKIPYGDITDTLENKQIVFFTGPLVSTATNIRMPPPSDIYGQWSWTHHPEVKVWREESITDSRKEQGQFFDDSLQISEGWLKLTTAPLAINFFIIRGKKPDNENQLLDKAPDTTGLACFVVPRGERIILNWAVSGADELELHNGSRMLFNSKRHPLPTQYAIQVDKDSAFTLRATDRAKETIQKTIKIHVA
jgi:hypothetical protein